MFNAAKSGVQVLNAGHLQAAGRLKVACDVNAVPPAGIEGVGVLDDAAPIAASSSGAVGIGALTVGNVKYHTQQLLLQQMYQADTPQYLDFTQSFEVARRYVS